jgi:hypothetical protein
MRTGRSNLLTAAKAALCFAALSLASCRQDMHDQPRYEAFEENDRYADSLAARPLVEHTVARGYLHEDEVMYTGKQGGADAAAFPFSITKEVLDRGQNRFNIYCTPCHGMTGAGDGMVVRRGFRQPPSFHQDRLREAAPGHFFDVMTNGFGAMADYSYQLPARDRWAVAAYIRALQASQHSAIADVPGGAASIPQPEPVGAAEHVGVQEHTEKSVSTSH